MTLKQSGSGRRIACWIHGIVLLVCLAAVGAAGQMPYFADLSSALASAKKNGRMVILYTGRTELCPGHDPKAFFFGSVLGTHLPLGARTNAYVVCEQFLVSPARDAGGELSSAFFAEASRYDALFTRYLLHVYYPAITILDTSGVILSGPYTYSAPDETFADTKLDSYEVLQEYGAANPPIHLIQGRSNLLAAIVATNKTDEVFQIVRAKYDKKRTQKEILLDSGVPSKAYELGKEVAFVVRECAVETFRYDGERGTSEVVAVGRLSPTEAFEGTVLVRLNGAYFRGEMRETGTYTGSGKVTFRPGEHFLTFVVPYEPAAVMLLRGMEGLRSI